MLVVGGGVRDHLLGQTPNDWDVEVFGFEIEALTALLNKLGSAHAVGKNFGVFKWVCDGFTIDVALPKRENHSPISEIDPTGEPLLSPTEAASRRDLTLNAISFDPLTGAYIDPFNGREDLAQGRLALVSPTALHDDPLRVLRVAQFSARLHLSPTPELIDKARSVSLTDLPAERIRAEWFKLLVTASCPSRGFTFLAACGQVQMFPVLQDHLLDSLDRLALRQHPRWSSTAHKWAAMLTVWLSGVSAVQAEQALEVLEIFTYNGLNIRQQVLAAHRLHETLDEATATLANCATAVDLEILCAVAGAVQNRGQWAQTLHERAEALGWLHSAPDPLLKGRHLKKLGLQPGPHMGPILAHAYQAQLDGEISTLDQALERVKQVLTDRP
jgi:tRNA nucleotidyltransferase (CCA-adding enzyme)